MFRKNLVANSCFRYYFCSRCFWKDVSESRRCLDKDNKRMAEKIEAENAERQKKEEEMSKRLQEAQEVGDTQLQYTRAGHNTTLPRQRDHVFRPQSCLLLHYYYCIFDVAAPLGHRDFNIFRCFLFPEALKRCFVVALALSRKLKLSSVQLRKKYTL